MIFWSSLTLPIQLYLFIKVKNGLLKYFLLFGCSLLYLFKKYSAHTSTSPFLSLKGGMHILKTLSLKYKSSLKFFLFTSSYKFLLLAAITRIFNFFSYFPPILLILKSSNTLNNLACTSNGSSPISSNKSVPPSANSNLPGLPSLRDPVKAPFS